MCKEHDNTNLVSFHKSGGKSQNSLEKKGLVDMRNKETSEESSNYIHNSKLVQTGVLSMKVYKSELTFAGCTTAEASGRCWGWSGRGSSAQPLQGIGTELRFEPHL